MMETRLKNQLDSLAQALRRARLWRALSICWALAAGVGLILLGLRCYVWVAPLLLGLALAGIAWRRFKKRPDDFRDLIGQIEPQESEVRHLLSAATEQNAGDASGAFTFLQWRVIDEALSHPRHHVWRQQLNRRLLREQMGQVVALAAFVFVLLALGQGARNGGTAFGSLRGNEISVTPGNTNMERGTGLVVAARYGGVPPVEATLVMLSASGREARIPMARRLADPVFGASVPEISEAASYHIEYAGKKSPDYKITLFEYPALVRADAELRYPAYTGLTNRTIRDTLRVSAVEGSHLRYTLQLNKPVARARWVAPGKSLALQTDSNAVALLPDFVLTNNARFTLELVDAEGRSNKFPSDFVLQALTNQRPDVQIVFPRGDPRVSRLQELQLQAAAMDDFGLLKYGVGFGVAGQEPQFIELGQAAPANARKQFEYLISFEKLGVEVDQSLCYFAWADDTGPDGQPRRTFSDMYFADVRPFEEIFRQDQSGADQEQNGGQGGGGDERVRLAQLQKQIVVATWNLEKNGAGRASHP
jgi:hypothetical protein